MSDGNAERQRQGLTDAEVTAQFDALYRGADPVWSGEPNGALVDEVSDLHPGRALDVGCGEGADAIWLAERGWHVTALDVAEAALSRAEQRGLHMGANVEWLHAGLLDARLTSETFDLVSAQYPALRHTADNAAVRTLMRLVAPGGTLLVVHHADVDTEEARARGFDPADYVSPDDVRQALDTAWVVRLIERRARHISGGAGARHTHDIVLRAQRLASASLDGSGDGQ